jgi:hypothetical protein
VGVVVVIVGVLPELKISGVEGDFGMQNDRMVEWFQL